MDLKLQLEVLDSFVNERYPHAKIVDFSTGVQWHKDRYNQSWSPSVLPEHRSALLKILCSSPALLSGDYAGCYETLLGQFQ